MAVKPKMGHNQRSNGRFYIVHQHTIKLADGGIGNINKPQHRLLWPSLLPAPHFTFSLFTASVAGREKKNGSRTRSLCSPRWPRRGGTLAPCDGIESNAAVAKEAKGAGMYDVGIWTPPKKIRSVC